MKNQKVLIKHHIHNKSKYVPEKPKYNVSDPIYNK
jgi:hypothetical protein